MASRDYYEGFEEKITIGEIVTGVSLIVALFMVFASPIIASALFLMAIVKP